MQIEDILDDLPTTSEELGGVVVALLERIDRLNRAVERHESYPDRNNLAIEEFTHVRNIYIGQLALLLQPFGVEVKPAQPDHDPEREEFLHTSGLLANRAYGDDEPEYTDADIKEHNPNYQPRDLTTP
jgi:hypothetical protein